MVRVCNYSIRRVVTRFFFQPTSSSRGWIISPLGRNPWWTLPAAAVPAALCTILVFMDQQITAVIVNRKENKLKVRTGGRGLSNRVTGYFLYYIIKEAGVENPVHLTA